MDQSEADRDLSVKQRMALAAGSTIQGAAGFAGDIEPLADALDVAGILQFLPHIIACCPVWATFLCLHSLCMLFFLSFMSTFMQLMLFPASFSVCIITT